MCSYFEFLPCKDCEAKYLNCDVIEVAFVTILLELELAIPAGAELQCRSVGVTRVRISQESLSAFLSALTCGFQSRVTHSRRKERE